MGTRGKALLAALLFVGAVISSYFAAEAYANYVLKEKFDRRLSKLPFPTAYRSFHYNLLKNDIEIEGLTLKEGEFYLTVGELYIDLPYTLRKKELPPYFSVRATEVEIPSYAPFLGELLKFTGYKKPYITVDLFSSYAFNSGGLEVFLTAVARGLGGLKTKVELGGIDRELARKIFEGRVPVRVIEKRGTLKELLLTYKDYGLFKMFLNFISSQEGESPDKVKEELKRTVYQAMKERKEVAQRLALPLLEFIDNPKCLKLTVKPQPPLKISQLIKWASEKPDIEESLRRLNLQLKTCH